MVFCICYWEAMMQIDKMIRPQQEDEVALGMTTPTVGLLINLHNPVPPT